MKFLGGNDAEIFRNRKGYFSVNVHVVGDADFSIRDIVARWPGSTHDSTIFSNSRIKHKFDQHEFNISCLLGKTILYTSRWVANFFFGQS